MTASMIDRTWRQSRAALHGFPAVTPEFGPWDLTDAGLDRANDELETALKWATNPEQKAALGNDLAANKRERVRREALRETWGACGEGTDSYDEHARLGQAPSYWLALVMDFTSARLGRESALDWSFVLEGEA